MATADKHLKKRLEYSGLLLEEARPFMIDEPRVWARQFGDAVSFGEVFGQMMKKSVPFATPKLRTDALVFHDVPTREGVLHAVQCYSGAGIQPTDFLITIDKGIPRAAYAKKGTLVSEWATSLSESGEKDSFVEFLDGIERGKGWKSEALIDHANKWTYHAGRVSVQLPYTMQLIPTGAAQFVYLFKRPYKPGMWSAKQMRFHVEEFMELARWLKEAIAGYDYDGPPADKEVLVPTLSLLAIPEFAESMSHQGTEVNWPAPSKRTVAQPPAQAAPPEAPKPSEGKGGPDRKFCIACGTQIPGHAAFCSSCGAKQ